MPASEFFPFFQGEMNCPGVKNYEIGYVPKGGSQDIFNWEETYEKESPVLYGYLVKKVGTEAAQDILQESFMRLIDLAERKGSPQNLRAYLFQIARNLISDLGHAPDVQYVADDRDPVFQNRETGETQLVKKEIVEVLQEAVRLLDTREAEVFDLRWNQGMSTEEIALIINTSDRHVRRILDKVAHKIEDLFRKKGWEPQHVLSA
ncbi:MAG: RNA polymerase sigma factor [Spirochaetota bacterium]